MLLSLELSKYKERERESRVLFCRLNPVVTYRAQQTKKEDIFTILPSSILMYIYIYMCDMIVSITVVTLSPPTTINYVELVSDILLL